MYNKEYCLNIKNRSYQRVLQAEIIDIITSKKTTYLTSNIYDDKFTITQSDLV